METPLRRFGDAWLLLILLVAAAAILAWWLRLEPRPATPEPAETQQETPRVLPDMVEPRHPVPPFPAADDRGRALTPLPPLEDSDAYFALALTDLFGRELGQWLVTETLIEKLVVTIDNLPRQQVAERMRPLSVIGTGFAAEHMPDSEMYLLGADNFARYDVVVTMLMNIDLDELVNIYRRFYPLFQQSYVTLGYPDGYFNDRAVEVIDHLLAAPSVDEPIYLIRPHVLFQYADPELEALSAGQKFLIRIGPEHATRLKGVLKHIRGKIATAKDEESQSWSKSRPDLPGNLLVVEPLPASQADS